MIPIINCVIEPYEHRKAWRYPRLSDWIGGAVVGGMICAFALFT